MGFGIDWVSGSFGSVNSTAKVWGVSRISRLVPDGPSCITDLTRKTVLLPHSPIRLTVSHCVYLEDASGENWELEPIQRLMLGHTSLAKE